MKIFNFLRKNLISFLVVALSVVMFFSVAAFCWFAQSDGFSTNFKSSTATAYFAGGDGSSEKPYQIKDPVHLYNLAWLQYLGYFNLRGGFNNGRAQSYFKLTADIDMSGYTLPPIGTEKYPFIGNFNGDGYAVTNLTVSNGFKDFNGKIYPVNAVFDKKENDGILYYFSAETPTTSAASFLGMFGVTGNYNNAVTADYSDTVHPVTDKLAEGTVPAKNEFYMSEMSVEGFYLDYVKVKSYANTALVGFVAGYVAGDVKNAGVYQSRIEFENAATAKTGDSISAYGLVGNYDSNSVAWAGKNDWGGSIDMKLLSQRISNIMATAGDGTEYYSTQASATVKNGFYYSEKYSFYGNYASEKSALSTLNYSFDPNGVSGDSVTVSLLGYSGYASDENKNYAYTVLPLNVNKSYLGLDGGANAETVKQNATIYQTNSGLNTSKFVKSSTALASSKWSLTEGYKNYNDTTYKTEPVLYNTGYIVGNSTSFNQWSAGIQINVRPFKHDKNIYKAFGATSASTVGAYNTKNLRLTTYVYDSTSNTSGFKAIADNYNKLTGTGTIESSKLLKYNDIRDDFDPFLGSNGYLYGLTFSSTGCKIKGQKDNSTQSQTIERIVNLNGVQCTKKLLTGAINFTVKEAGVVVAIVGTHNVKSNVNQSAFNIYEVDQDTLSANGSTISGVTEIKTVYKDSDGKIYNNPTDTTDKTLVYNRDWYNVEDNSSGASPGLENNNAYYIEIPLEAGDYVLGTDSNTLGYLMYLDIGATGSGKHAVSMVDFVNYCDTKTLKQYIAANNGKYPQFDDITAKISAVTAGTYVSFRRQSTAGATFPESKSLLGYVSNGLTIGFTPTGDGTVDPEAENAWQKSG